MESSIDNRIIPIIKNAEYELRQLCEDKAAKLHVYSIISAADVCANNLFKL